jgi:hypothetical protein
MNILNRLRPVVSAMPSLDLSILHGLAADIFILEQSRTLIFNLNTRLVAKNCNIWRQSIDSANLCKLETRRKKSCLISFYIQG